MEEEHRGEIWDDVIDVVGCFGGEEGDYAESWEGLEGVAAFAEGVLVVSDERRMNGDGLQDVI